MKEIKFDLSELNKGITRFEVRINAQDMEAAMIKLVEYLKELSQSFSPPAIHVDDQATPMDIGSVLCRRLNALGDPIAFVITLHLFTEYWINRWIKHTFPKGDLTSFSYAQKLNKIEARGDFPEELAFNLRKLNKLRNSVAHNLNFDFSTMDLAYRGCLPGFDLASYKPSLNPNSRQHHISNVLGVLVGVTYLPLHNHFRACCSTGSRDKTEFGIPDEQ